MSRLRSFAIVALPVVIGCSGRVPTSDLSAQVTATIDREQMRVSVLLTEPFETGYAPPYVIEPDEHVLIGFRGVLVDSLFSAFADPGEPTYGAKFSIDGEVAADEPITVTLDRGAGDRVELVGMPAAPFTLQLLAAPPESQDFVLGWAPTSTDPMEWRAYCELSGSYGTVTEDSGMITIPYGMLTQDFCREVQFVFLRSHATMNDTALSYSRFTVTQVSRVLARLTP